MLDWKIHIPLKIISTLLLLFNDATCAPVMYTYIDESGHESSYSSYFKNWKNAWTAAGYKIEVLTPKDAMIHSLYSKFKQRMDDKHIFHAPRISYMRSLASECIVVD